MTHEIKCFDIFFNKIITGEKSFEVRKNDRNYQVGDYIEIQEICGKKYTGRICIAKILYILHAESFPEAIMPGYAVLSIRIENVFERNDIKGKQYDS